MKKLFYLACMVGLIGATTSCKKDDADPVVANQASMAGKTFSIKSGVIDDYGYWSGHYNYDFYLTDAQNIDYNSEVLNGEILIYLELLSASETEFKTGTFNFDDSGETVGKNYFDYAEVLLDTNDDGVLDAENDEYTIATGGKVTVSGTKPNYTVTYELTFEDNKKLTGTYSGAFHFLEDNEGYPEGERKAKKRLF